MDARSGIISLPKSIEYMPEEFRLDALAAVCNAHLDSALLHRDADINPAASWGEFNGIRQQVRDDLPQPICIARHRSRHVGELLRQRERFGRDWEVNGLE